MSRPEFYSQRHGSFFDIVALVTVSLVGYCSQCIRRYGVCFAPSVQLQYLVSQSLDSFAISWLFHCYWRWWHRLCLFTLIVFSQPHVSFTSSCLLQSLGSFINTCLFYNQLSFTILSLTNTCFSGNQLSFRITRLSNNHLSLLQSVVFHNPLSTTRLFYNQLSFTISGLSHNHLSLSQSSLSHNHLTLLQLVVFHNHWGLSQSLGSSTITRGSHNH